MKTLLVHPSLVGGDFDSSVAGLPVQQGVLNGSVMLFVESDAPGRIIAAQQELASRWNAAH